MYIYIYIKNQYKSQGKRIQVHSSCCNTTYKKLNMEFTYK
uniref:Uncharacterized protein n=1 Tax=Anguilla anguilla TaxID=7936 RepID=A0A0E9S3K2_ANGAN